MTKVCKTCGATKPVEEFFKNSGHSDGRLNHCKACYSIYQSTRVPKKRVIISEKQCSKCKEVKSVDEFYRLKKSTDGYLSECKQCTKNSPSYHKKRKEHRLRVYSISMEQLEQMFVSQEGKCAICTKEFKHWSKMHVDHNHTTGKVRQLLCASCNTGIGFFKEDISILSSAIQYIKKWNAN